MTQRIAILENGLVTNVAVYPDAFVPDGVTTVIAPSNVGKGWTFDGTFTPPPPPPTPDPTATGAQMIDEAEARGQLDTLLAVLTESERAMFYTRRRIVAGSNFAEVLRGKLGVSASVMASFIADASGRTEV